MPVTPVRPEGCDGAGPSAALSLLNDATASPASRAPCIRACGARNAVTWSCRADS